MKRFIEVDKNYSLLVQGSEKIGGVDVPMFFASMAVRPAPSAVHGESLSQLTQMGSPISFQNGPIREVGVNGISNECLATMIKARLEAFQEGDFACDENAEQLKLIERFLEISNERTARRQAKGIEGTSTVDSDAEGKPQE